MNNKQRISIAVTLILFLTVFGASVSIETNEEGKTVIGTSKLYDTVTEGVVEIVTVTIPTLLGFAPDYCEDPVSDWELISPYDERVAVQQEPYNVTGCFNPQGYVWENEIGDRFTVALANSGVGTYTVMCFKHSNDFYTKWPGEFPGHWVRIYRGVDYTNADTAEAGATAWMETFQQPTGRFSQPDWRVLYDTQRYNSQCPEVS